jgi:hypothetical protein
MLAALTVDETRRAMADWRAKADALDDGDADGGMPERALRHSPTLGNRFVTSGEFDAEGGELIATKPRPSVAGGSRVNSPRP